MDFWYFQTDTDEAAAYPVSTIQVMETAATAITIAFSGGGGTFLQKVVLTVTAGLEEKVLKALCGFASPRPGYGKMVIADDQNGEYCHPGITACGAITTDIAA
jgi:hypothetical protein